MTSYTYGAVLSWTIITDKSLLDHCSKTKCSGMVRWDSHLKTIKLRRIELYVWVWDGWEMQGPTQTNQDSPKQNKNWSMGCIIKNWSMGCIINNMWSDKNIFHLNFNKPYLPPSSSFVFFFLPHLRRCCLHPLPPINHSLPPSL